MESEIKLTFGIGIGPTARRQLALHIQFEIRLHFAAHIKRTGQLTAREVAQITQIKLLHIELALKWHERFCLLNFTDQTQLRRTQTSNFELPNVNQPTAHLHIGMDAHIDRARLRDLSDVTLHLWLNLNAHVAIQSGIEQFGINRFEVQIANGHINLPLAIGELSVAQQRTAAQQRQFHIVQILLLVGQGELPLPRSHRYAQLGQGHRLVIDQRPASLHRLTLGGIIVGGSSVQRIGIQRHIQICARQTAPKQARIDVFEIDMSLVNVQPIDQLHTQLTLPCQSSLALSGGIGTQIQIQMFQIPLRNELGRVIMVRILYRRIHSAIERKRLAPVDRQLPRIRRVALTQMR